jgi:hypothetical protein
MANRIQLRRDGAQQWANINPILAQGELGIEIDTSRIKIGDGVTPWNSLRYERPLETESNAANTLVKRDADGNFEAGAISATLIGNASTSTRLANARQIQMTGAVTASGSFDGSANLNLATNLEVVPSLPHYNPNDLEATGTYSLVQVDSRGRVIGAQLASTLSDYGITDAQPLDSDLTSLATLTTLGLLSRTSQGSILTRTLTGGAGRIIFTNADGVNANPFIDLADTAVVVGSYNVEALTSSGTGSQTVNATKFTVDRYGRLTYALTVPIATATEGSKYAAYGAGTSYSRYDIIEEGNGVYQAIRTITAGSGAPTHNDSSDAGGWRYLGAALTEQKGLASFAQEDFDVDANGHVTIASAAVDNTQLQNNRIIFTDRNTVQQFELDNELTTANAHNGFDYLNYIYVNDTSGNLLFTANNTANSGSGGVDINVDTNISGANIYLDRPGTSPLQTIERTAGSLKIFHNVNSATDRVLDIVSTNAGAGNANINITADNGIVLTATDVSAKIQVENYYFQENVLGTSNSTMVLDPGDDDAATGLVQIRGNLQVDGTTTTVNSTTITVDDPIITLGGDTTPTSDDGKDRGIEFRYYDTQARLGYFGWDEDYTDSNIWSGTGGYRFLYNATNTNEVFSGTDAPLIAGNLKLTTNTGSTSTTTGTLVVTGGVGVSQNIYVGGVSNFAGRMDLASSFNLTAAGQWFRINNGSTNVFYVNSDNGNTSVWGDIYQFNNKIIQTNGSIIIDGANQNFRINNGSSQTKFSVESNTGNTYVVGTLITDGGVSFNSTLDVDDATTLNSTLDVDGNTVLHDNLTIDTTGKTFKLTNGTSDKFVVSSTNGNTDIEGTLNVAGLTFFENIDEPTVSTDVDNYFVIVGGDYGAFRFAGGGYVEGDTLFNQDVYINGTLNQRDQGTTSEVFSTQNYLRVRYKLRAGSSIAYTPAYAQDNNSNLRVYGGAGIATDLHIGDNLYIGRKTGTADPYDFYVQGTTGNTIIGRSGVGSQTLGTLTVYGDTTLDRDLYVNQNTYLGNNIASDYLTVNAIAQFNSTVTIAAGKNLTVGGNAIIDGNLTVHGTTTTVNSTVVTVDDPILTLGGDTAPTTNDAKDRGVEFRYYSSGAARLGFYGWDESAGRYAFYHAATNASEVFSGTRSGLDVGSIKIFDTTNSTSTSTGALIVGGGAGIGLNLSVGSNLIVGSTGYFGSNLDVIGDFDLTSDFRINANKFVVTATTGNTSIAGTLGVTAATTLSSTLAVTGNTTVGGTLGISGATTLNSTLAVTGNTTVSGTLGVTGATSITNILGVSGVTSITNTGDATTTGTYSGDGALRITGGGSVAKNWVVGGNLKVYGDAIYDGDINYAGTQTYTGRARFNNTTDATSATNNNVSVFSAGGLAITKKAFIGDDLDVGAGTFTVDGPTGNTVISGTLNVTSASSLSTLSLSSSAAFASSLTLGGNLAINTDRFTVASTTGNTVIAGTLNVSGSSTISNLTTSGTVTFNGANTISLSNSGSYFSNSGLTRLMNTNDSSGYNNTSASLFVNGGVSIVKKLNVGGDFNVGGSAGVKAYILASSGNINTSGTLAVGSAATIGGTLGVTGQITGNVTGNLTGTADKSDLIGVLNTTTSNLTYYPTFVSATSGYTEVRTDSDNLRYNPSTNTLQVSNFTCSTNFEVQGNLNITGTVTYTNSQVGDISNHDTDDLIEGLTNKYFTQTRSRESISVSGSLSYNSGTGVISYTTPTTIASLSNHDTTDLAEGNNLYFTTARARASISASGSLSYNSSTGVISYTAPTLAAVATSGSYSDLTGRPTISTFGASLIDDADAATARATLGLGTAATTASTAYATAAQGTAADDTNSDLTALYSALNAIGNNAGITTVAQLKAALAALTRP